MKQSLNKRLYIVQAWSDKHLESTYSPPYFHTSYERYWWPGKFHLCWNQHFYHMIWVMVDCFSNLMQMLQHAKLLRKKLNNQHLQWLCYLSTTSLSFWYCFWAFHNQEQDDVYLMECFWVLTCRCLWWLWWCMGGWKVSSFQHIHTTFKFFTVTKNSDLDSHYLVCFSYEPNPESELAKLRLAAEEGWLS